MRTPTSAHQAYLDHRCGCLTFPSCPECDRLLAAIAKERETAGMKRIQEAAL